MTAKELVMSEKIICTHNIIERVYATAIFTRAWCRSLISLSKLDYLFNYFLNEVPIYTLLHLKCIRLLVSVRSSHLPYKMHSVGFRAFKFPFYLHRRANRTDLFQNKPLKATS